MCNFASFVLTKDSVFYLPDSESHTRIISTHGIVESGAKGLNVVKVEILPPKGVIALDNISDWKVIFDQDTFPEWHDPEKSARRARSLLHEKLTNLQTLYASNSQIVDVSALTNLQTLYASNSQIVDVSALTNLQTLYARGSQIVDVSALTNLQTLDARGSQIVDVSALTNLQTLYASDSQIVDVSALTNLQTLYASDSQIAKACIAQLKKRGVRVY